MRATGTQRVPPVASTSSQAFSPNLAFPDPTVDSMFLVEQSEPVVRRYVLQVCIQNREKRKFFFSVGVSGWEPTKSSVRDGGGASDDACDDDGSPDH